MPRLACLLVLFLNLAIPARGQDEAPGSEETGAQNQGDQGPSTGGDAEPPPSSGNQGENQSDDGGHGGQEENRPLTLEDARISFGSIVQAFIELRSPEGFWPLRDKKSGRIRQLKFVSVEEKKIALVRDLLYRGPVLLTDLKDGKSVSTLFTVDFSGTQWKVVGMKMLPSKPGRNRRAAPAPAPAT